MATFENDNYQEEGTAPPISSRKFLLNFSDLISIRGPCLSRIKGEHAVVEKILAIPLIFSVLRDKENVDSSLDRLTPHHW